MATRGAFLRDYRGGSSHTFSLVGKPDQPFHSIKPTGKYPQWLLEPYLEGKAWAARQPVHVSVVCVHCCSGDGELERVGRFAKAHTDCLAVQLRSTIDTLVQATKL